VLSEPSTANALPDTFNLREAMFLERVRMAGRFEGYRQEVRRRPFGIWALGVAGTATHWVWMASENTHVFAYAALIPVATALAPIYLARKRPDWYEESKAYKAGEILPSERDPNVMHQVMQNVYSQGIQEGMKPGAEQAKKVTWILGVQTIFWGALTALRVF